MDRLDELFEQFLRERTYVQNITPKTRVWYESAWKAFLVFQTEPAGSPDPISRAQLSGFVIHLRQRGVRPVSCNSWIRALDAFCRWLFEQEQSTHLVKVAPQRLERRLLATHTEATVCALLRFRPSGFAQLRIQTLVCTILDTGCRIDELLTAKCADVDFKDLLITVMGKGRKTRRVPFGINLRKRVFRLEQMRNHQELSIVNRLGG
jgi:site-specific recombinase XerD